MRIKRCCGGALVGGSPGQTAWRRPCHEGAGVVAACGGPVRNRCMTRWRCHASPRGGHGHGVRPSRSALATTDTELRLMASAATIGLSRSPVAGYSTPAASGTPIAL